MSLDLDNIKKAINAYLKENGFVVFHGHSRRMDEMREVDWDVEQYPDFREFLDVARSLDIKPIVLHHRDFSDSVIDNALESLEDAGFEYDGQRTCEQRLRELRMYDGFTCAVELSFEYQDTLYVYDLQTDWYRELTNLLDEIEISSTVDQTEEDDNPLGGYYSQN